MKIFDWMHRKLQHCDGYSVVSHKKDGLDDDGRRPSTLTWKRDTEAPLLRQDHVTLVKDLDSWHDGILAIGTFGLEHYPFFDEYSVPDEKYSVPEMESQHVEDEEEEEEEELDPTEMKALEQDLVRNFAADNGAGGKGKEMLKSKGPFGGSPDLNGEDAKTKKKGERTTLADLFSADPTFSATEKCEADEMKSSSMKSGKKKKKQVQSLAKKLVPWKEDGYSLPTAKLHGLLRKMLKRKIHPEFDQEIHEAIGPNGTKQMEETNGLSAFGHEMIGNVCANESFSLLSEIELQ